MIGPLARRSLQSRFATFLGRRAQRFTLPALLGVLVGLTVLSDWVGPDWFPASLLVLPLLLGGLALVRRRDALLVLAAALVGMTALVGLTSWRDVRLANFLLLLVAGVITVTLVSNRERLGISGLRGDTMLAELRERLQVQGELPELPGGWCAEMMLRSANDAGFGGDFLVCSVTNEGNGLELALVDVSGKGVDAGTRALLLSGALGGLLGAVPPEEFLPAANAYLCRQNWHEGFATAVHIAIDLVTGEYLLDNAGHPPAAQFKAGSGVWTLSEAEGSVLGIFEDGKWVGVRGQLERGDALLAYTDGLVEVPGRDLAMGIDQLLGEANQLVVSSFDGGAAKLIDAVAPVATDDRAVLLAWRV